MRGFHIQLKAGHIIGMDADFDGDHAIDGLVTMLLIVHLVAFAADPAAGVSILIVAILATLAVPVARHAHLLSRLPGDNLAVGAE